MYNPRIKRALKEKLFLVDIKETDNFYEKHFSVMGTTGNIYTVKIKLNSSTCNCPDYIKRKDFCKHIYFVYIKVLKADQDFEDEHQDESWLLNLYNNLERVTQKLYASEVIREIYINKIKNDSKTNLNNNIGIKVQKKDKDCPVCMDILENGENIDFCKFGCGKSIHSQCFKMFCTKNLKMTPKCVYCRTEWDKNVENDNTNKENSDFPSEYINVLGNNNSNNFNSYYYRPWTKRRYRNYDQYLDLVDDFDEDSDEDSSEDFYEDSEEDSSEELFEDEDDDYESSEKSRKKTIVLKLKGNS